MNLYTKKSRTRLSTSTHVANDQSERHAGESLDSLLSRLENLDESQLLANLQVIYSQRQLLHDVVCEKFTSEQSIDFHRQAAVYHRKMHNKFFVPVWAAAMGETDGYILYPKLTSLSDILPSFVISERPGEEDELAMIRLMRRCFLPVAMAIDALHTPVPNHRTMYYHRDICIDNVYLCQSAVGQGKVYGDAMLRLTKLTRGSHEQESLNVSHSVGNYTFLKKYFHHPSPWRDPLNNVYHRRYDWFSFGVYILDVIIRLLCDENDEFPPLESIRCNEKEYNELVAKLKAHVDKSVVFNKQRTKQFILQHLSVACTCLSLGDDDIEQVLHYDLPDELKRNFHDICSLTFKPYHFEYGVNEWTAQMLWLYDDSRPEGEDFQLNEVKVEGKSVSVRVCQACLLRPVVMIPTRTYRREEIEGEAHSKSKCDIHCHPYCSQCYTNRERLFCPYQHGTTSTIIGHYSSYALILYGHHPNDVFEKDATAIENVLKHKLICGIPDENVSRRKVFDPESPGNEEKCLEEACLDMRHRIHNRQLAGGRVRETDTCVNDASYTLFIFYSGHGAKGGHWCPYITYDDEEKHKKLYELSRNCIDNYLAAIRQCTNTTSPSCNTDCIEVTYILDHCNTMTDNLKVVKEVDNQKAPSALIVTTEPGTKAKASLEHNSELTRWFCELLRCVPFDHKHSDHCEFCVELQDYIRTECHNVFINARCLELSSGHFSPHFGFESEAPRIIRDVRAWHTPKRNNLNVVAYYQPQGIYYKVFSYKEGREPADVQFHCQVTCDQVKEGVIAELKRKDEEKEKRRREYSSVNINICLLANLANDHSKYTLVSDSTIRRVLDSSLLFYHVITQPVEVKLLGDSAGGPIKDTLVNFELDFDNLLMLVEREKCPLPASQLPNIFVHIVHHLWLQIYEGGVTTDLDRSGPPNSVANGSQISQPSTSQAESDVTDRERLHSSFAERLGGETGIGTQVKFYSPDDWLKLEERASLYRRDSKLFHLEMTTDNLLIVRWDMTSSGGAPVPFFHSGSGGDMLSINPTEDGEDLDDVEQ